MMLKGLVIGMAATAAIAAASVFLANSITAGYVPEVLGVLGALLTSVFTIPFIK